MHGKKWSRKIEIIIAVSIIIFHIEEARPRLRHAQKSTAHVLDNMGSNNNHVRYMQFKTSHPPPARKDSTAGIFGVVVLL